MNFTFLGVDIVASFIFSLSLNNSFATFVHRGFYASNIWCCRIYLFIFMPPSFYNFSNYHFLHNYHHTLHLNYYTPAKFNKLNNNSWTNTGKEKLITFIIFTIFLLVGSNQVALQKLAALVVYTWNIEKPIFLECWTP